MQWNLRTSALLIVGIALALWLPAFLARSGYRAGAIAASIAEALAATAWLKLAWPDRIADPRASALVHLVLMLMILLEVMALPCLIFS